MRFVVQTVIGAIVRREYQPVPAMRRSVRQVGRANLAREHGLNMQLREFRKRRLIGHDRAHHMRHLSALIPVRRYRSKKAREVEALMQRVNWDEVESLRDLGYTCKPHQGPGSLR
jgi:hypothetical protein